jgi:PAS domain S-box-containing protein
MAENKSIFPPGTTGGLTDGSIALALEAAGIGLWHIELSGEKPISCDNRCREFLGLAPDSKVDYAQVIACIHHEDLASSRQTMSLDPESGKYEVKLRVKAINGSQRLLRLTGKAGFENGVLARLSGIATDITRDLEDLSPELSAHKAMLSEAEDMFRHVTTSSPTGLWLSDPQGSLIYLNETLVTWTGMSYESLLGTGWASAIIDQDREKAVAAFQDAIEKRAHYDVEFRIRKADDSIIWCRAAGDPFYMKDGSYAGYSGFCMDINDYVKITESFRESEARINNIIEQAPIAIGVLRGRDFIVEMVNQDILDAWGKQKSIVGQPLLQALPELEGQPFIGLLEKVYDTGEAFYAYATPAKLLRNGVMEDVYSDFVYTAVRDAAGQINGVMILAMIVTEQVIAKQKLEASESKLRGIIASAPAGIGLFVGRDLVIENPNQTFIDIVGKGPDIVGLPLREAMPELVTEGQPFLKILDDVFTTGVMFQSFGSQVKIVQNGVLTYNYYNITYTPIFDAGGEVYAILDIAIDVTEEVKARQKLEDTKAQLRDAIEVAELGTWDLDPFTNKFQANDRLKDWFGLPPESEVPLNMALDVIHDNDRQRVSEAISAAADYSSGGNYDIEYTIINPVNGQERVVKAKGKTSFDENNVAYRFNGTLQDITQQVTYRKRLEESELYARNVFYNSPVAKMVFTGPDMVLTSINENMFEMLGRDESIVGKPFVESMPHLLGSSLMDRMIHVFTTGETYHQPEEKISFLKHGEMHTGYYSYIYKPLRNTEGHIYGIMCTCTDITDQVMSKKNIEQSEARFRGLIELAPFPTCVFRGRDLVIDIANEAMLKTWGKGNKVLGRPLVEALPEMEGQPFIGILLDIFETGKAYHAYEEKAELVVDGILQEFYFNFTYQPLFDDKGNVYAIMDMAMDVTEHVLNKKRIFETDARLKMAIETANLGTWEIDLLNNEFIASERVNNWFGLNKGNKMSMETFLKHVDDKDKFTIALAKARDIKGPGILDIEFTTTNTLTGAKYILHSVGQAFFNEAGEAYLVTGSIKDITLQKNIEFELENQVQVRTEELQATNEELETTNEELAETIDNLNRSNDELSQYAYIASHDLQEPLRKIQVFSGILENQDGLTDQNRKMVGKISQSSNRMTMLIKDLLEFSKIQSPDKLSHPVDLSVILHEVINDFELIIQEKQADIRVLSVLPTLDVVSLQMNQLFYNLINNALKFVDHGERPVIEISSRTIDHQEVRQHLPRASESNTYYDITIRDEGIGFDVKFSEQIFEVFKRLHGRDVYPGSGIGLALCKKIVTNHGGILYAESELGHGSAFHIILPYKH